MATQTPVQVTFGGLQTEYSNRAATHKTLKVNKTATMENGSALVAAGTEAALLDVALVTQVIDDPSIDLVEVGADALVSVAYQGCIFNTDAINYSDAGAFVPADAVLLNTNLNTFK